MRLCTGDVGVHVSCSYKYLMSETGSGCVVYGCVDITGSIHNKFNDGITCLVRNLANSYV